MNLNLMNNLNLLICVLNKFLKWNLENLFLLLFLKLILVYVCICKKDVFILLRIYKIYVSVNVMKCRYLLWNFYKDIYMLLFVLRNNVFYIYKVLIILKMKEIKKKNKYWSM